MAKETNSTHIRSYGFTKSNLVIGVVSVIIIIVGYILLSGGKSADGVSFNPEVFNKVRIGVAPVVLTIGYIGILVAVLWRDKHHKGGETNGEKEQEQK